MKMQITHKQLAAANLVYWWLLLAPLIAVPCWMYNYSLISPANLLGSIYAAGVPLVFYLPVFVWAFSPEPFLKAHARQGTLLLALRFLFGVLAGAAQDWMLPILCWDIFPWLVGSLIGFALVKAGRSWIGNIHAKVIQPPEAAPRPPSAEPPKPTREQLIASFLQAFRSDDPAAREDAARWLESLGQVEIF